MKLVIFDLDQTLVDFLPVHDKACEQVFQRFFKVNARLTEVDFAGRSLIDNFVELARLKKIPEDSIRQNSQKLLESYDEAFVRHFPRNPARYILPGVKRLLERVSRTGHLVALYTGDSPKIADKVLFETGLGKYFQFAQYGTQVKTRADMVKLALKKAKRLTGRTFEGKDIVIIGDSLRDIECGKEFNALTIAVATGSHSKEQLVDTHGHSPWHFTGQASLDLNPGVLATSHTQ